MRTTVFHGARVVETIWYTRADQQAVEVTVEDGKVTKVSQSPSAEGLSAGVVVLE